MSFESGWKAFTVKSLEAVLRACFLFLVCDRLVLCRVACSRASRMQFAFPIVNRDVLYLLNCLSFP